MPQRRRLPAEWKRIREVFLHRRPSYGSAEVPALLGIPESTLRQAIEEGTVAAIPSGGGELRIAWEDVVALGLEHRWTYRLLTAALRGRSAAALPPLVRVKRGHVELPDYQWQILRLLAARRAHDERREITASDLLEEAVTTALLTPIDERGWERLDAALPGVRAAAWPPAD
ncbi:MAG TPA: hypothetical protein VF432_32010 [Thermoanaerobaculia bacterium]